MKTVRNRFQRVRVYRRLDQKSMTVQSEKDPSDVNVIVARFQRTGEMPPNPRGQEPQYVDCTPYQEDITEAHNRAIERLEEAGRDLEKQRLEKEKADQEQARLLNEELEELRKLKKPQPPEAAGALPTSPDTA